jgi:hypothetical protein
MVYWSFFFCLKNWFNQPVFSLFVSPFFPTTPWIRCAVPRAAKPKNLTTIGAATRLHAPFLARGFTTTIVTTITSAWRWSSGSSLRCHHRGEVLYLILFLVFQFGSQIISLPCVFKSVWVFYGVLQPTQS